MLKDWDPGRFVVANMVREARAAGCVILYSDGVVLRHTADGHWVFPKGHVEAGESLPQTAAREAAEETGLEVEILRPLGELHIVHKGENLQVMYFLARAVGELPAWRAHLGHDAAVVPVADVRDKLTFANSRELWDEFYRSLKEQAE